MPRAIHPAKDKAITRLETMGTSPMAHVRHKLRKWMMANGITIREMARLCAMGRPQLTDLLNGVCRNKTHMTLLTAFAIEYVTKGHVQAWEWLDDPYQMARLRKSRLAAAMDYEDTVKRIVLRGKGGGTPDGVLRNKARTLSRIFQVNWAEVKRRAWEDARKAAAWETADVSHLMLSKDGD